MRPTRLISIGDASALTQLLIENRDFLAPWEPVGGEEPASWAQHRIAEGLGAQRL